MFFFINSSSCLKNNNIIQGVEVLVISQISSHFFSRNIITTVLTSRLCEKKVNFSNISRTRRLKKCVVKKREKVYEKKNRMLSGNVFDSYIRKYAARKGEKVFDSHENG